MQHRCKAPVWTPAHGGVHWSWSSMVWCLVFKTDEFIKALVSSFHLNMGARWWFNTSPAFYSAVWAERFPGSQNGSNPVLRQSLGQWVPVSLWFSARNILRASKDNVQLMQ